MLTFLRRFLSIVLNFEILGISVLSESARKTFAITEDLKSFKLYSLSLCFFPLRYRLLLWTPLAPDWWPVATTMTCGSGTLPAWTRLCRPSDRSSRATGESTSEKATTRSCLTCASSVPCKCWRCVCVCHSPHKHICRAWWSLTLTHGHPLVSFKMSPFRCRWLSYATVYVSKLVYSKALIKDQILFLRAGAAFAY